MLVVTVLAGGLACSVAAASAVGREQHRHAGTMMDRYAADVTSAVRDEAEDYTATLSHLAAGLGAQSKLTADDFAAVTSRVDPARLPGANGVIFVVPARDSAVSEVERSWRSRGQPGLDLDPADGVKEHLFLVLGRTLDGTALGLGRDMGQAAEPAEAMLAARTGGQISAARTYVLLKDRALPENRRQRSFVIAAPVYDGGATPAEGAFRGWVVMGMRGEDFIAQTLRDRSHDKVAVRLVDLSVPTAPQVVASSAGRALLHDAALKRVRTVQVGGRVWRLEISPTTSLMSPTDRNLGVGVLVTGSVITLLLSSLVGVLAGARNRALTRVDHATSALRIDIEQRKHTEARLREREAELEAFAGVAAHDLKAPLFAIAGLAEVLREDYADRLDEGGRECLVRILNGTRRMSHLIDELLAYAAARDGDLTVQRVDLGRIAADIVTERTSGSAERPARVDLGDLPTVQADPILMHHLLDNLIGNALKHVREDRPAEITVRARPEPSAGWYVEVTDQGIGVPPDRHDAIFRAFSQGGDSAGHTGTGLGLAVCKRIVERHGGRIGVEANPDGGSRFWFTLPGRPDTAMEAQARGKDARSVPGTSVSG